MNFLALPVGGTLKKFARFARAITVSPPRNMHVGKPMLNIVSLPQRGALYGLI